MADLAIEIDWGGGRVRAVRMQGARPEPARVLAGLKAPEVLPLLARLYAVCGRAQSACAELALAAAGAALPAGARRTALAQLTAAEAVQEHLWRLLLDWPRALGLPPETDLFRRWYARIAAAEPGWALALRTSLERDWLGIPLTGAAAFASVDAFDAWRRAGATPAARLFAALATEHAARAAAGTPALAAGESQSALAAEAEHPLVAGLIAAGRHLEAHVAARLVALLATTDALARGSAGPDMDAESLSEGHGRALVTTARGMLEHEVTLEGGRVARYAIRTPTDANFAPDGPFVRCLEGLGAASAGEAKRSAELWALAFDPCVSYAVAVVEPPHA